MDVLTLLELTGTIIHKNNAKSQTPLALGFTIDIIFSSFPKQFASLPPGELTIPWDSLPLSIRDELPQPSKKDFQLYNPFEKCWNWPLFSSQPRGSTPSSLIMPLATPEPMLSSELTTENYITYFYNAIAAATRKYCINLGRYADSGVHRHWMGDWSHNVLPGSQYDRKLDLILIDNSTAAVDKVTWLSPKVVGEYTRETL
ncbi:hypothetical protein OG21DRAFT_1491318 [Imleria badia]|nr:hypothetical protein OG21DRAFT_1491318 [Imleria badia]